MNQNRLISAYTTAAPIAIRHFEAAKERRPNHDSTVRNTMKTAIAAAPLSRNVVHANRVGEDRHGDDRVGEQHCAKNSSTAVKASREW